MIATDNQSRIMEVLLEIFKAKGLAAPALTSETVLDQPFATGAEYQIKTLSDLAILYD
jgi:hypothetical protein